MIRKLIAMGLTTIMFASLSQPIIGENEIGIYLNNQEVVYDETYGYPFVDESDRTQVPFRLTLEKFGATVSWDYETQTAIAEKDGIVVKVPLGEIYFYKNDEVIINDTHSIAIDGRIYVPIRAIMEAFGCDVTWISATNSVYIDYDSGEILSSIPRSFDLRYSNRVTSVKDQGEIGACWAFGAIGAIESYLTAQGLYDFSEDHLSMGHGYNLAPNDGGDVHVAMSYFAGWKGPVLEKDDPYGDFSYNKEAEVAWHVQEIMVIEDKDYASIKLSIMDYGAVETYLFLHYLTFQGASEFYNPSTAAYYYDGTASANHDVLIVGWDDTYSKTNFKKQPSKDGAFICKNSYGEDFGDEGYFYVSYEDVRIGETNVVYSSVEPTDNYDMIYQYDDLGWIGTVGYGKNTAFFSNVYETKAGLESLEAVSFYATGADSQYEVYVVTEFENQKDMKNRVLVERGKLSYAGYYTVPFTESIEVEGRFAVIVKLSTPGSTRPIAVEMDKDLPWLGDVEIAEGYGLISPDGSNWSRSEKLLESNVCLKAFTTDIEIESPIQIPQGGQMIYP